MKDKTIVGAMAGAIILAVVGVVLGAVLTSNRSGRDDVPSYSVKGLDTSYPSDAGADGAAEDSDGACNYVEYLIAAIVDPQVPEPEVDAITKAAANQARAEGQWQIAVNADALTTKSITYAFRSVDAVTRPGELDRIASLCGLAVPTTAAERQAAIYRERRNQEEAQRTRQVNCVEKVEAKYDPIFAARQKEYATTSLGDGFDAWMKQDEAIRDDYYTALEAC